MNIDFALGQGAREDQYGHSLAICESGSVVGFGRNDDCQIGTGSHTTVSYEYPYQVNDITNAVAVAAGRSHSLALLDNGTVMAWGKNQYGEAGQSGSSDICDPTEVELPGCAVAISAGNGFSLALLANGSVWAWGNNDYGQLGNGDDGTSTYIPDSVLGGVTNVIAISAGSAHAMALLDDGTVKVWGFGSNGEMGNGTNGSINDIPVTPSGSGFSDIVQIDAGDQHCVTRKSNGDIYVWGYNLKGQLGQGNTTASNIPIKSNGLSSSIAIDIAAGVNFTIVLKSDGNTKATGINSRGELGNCDYTLDNYTTPIPGEQIVNCIDICTPSTASHTLAVKSNGDLYGWGDDSKDQLGVVTSAPHHVCSPVLINDPYIVWEEPAGYYCPVKPSEDNHPQPCCVAIREDERTVLDGVTITSNTTYTGQNLALRGTITINSGSLKFDACDVVCEPTAKIILNGGLLYITEGSHLYACSEMWYGIEVANGTILIVDEGSTIEDALTAIDLEYGAAYAINDAVFNRNYQHLRKTMPSSGSPVYTSDYRIVRSQFLCQTYASIGTTPVYVNLLPPHETEITVGHIAALGVPKILVGSVGNGNVFDKASWLGIFADEVTRVEIIDNDFSNSFAANYVTDGPGNGGETIDINYNSYELTQYPIYCYDQSPTVRAQIAHNEIDFDGMGSPPPVDMRGITVEEITPAGGTTSTDYNYFDISENTIEHATTGIYLENLRGNNDGGEATLWIYDNYITHSGTATDQGAGIKTENVTESAIISNEITHPTSSLNWHDKAMRISGGNGNVLYCNDMHHLGTGILFEGYQTTQTAFATNTFDRTSTAFALNWGDIGPQPPNSSYDPRDNKWIDSLWWDVGSSRYTTMVLGTHTHTTEFGVRVAALSRYYPNENEKYDLGGTVIPVSVIGGTWQNSCEVLEGPASKTDDGSSAEQYLRVIQPTEAQSQREANQQWIGQYGLYDRLTRDEQLRSSSTELEGFFEENGGTNVGRLHAAVNSFQAARSGQGADGAIQLQAVAPQNSVEQTLADVLAVLYANVTDLGALDEQETTQLREIARRCPLDDGFGVYMARAALLKVDTFPRNYANECEVIPRFDGERNKVSIAEDETQFSIYPNPNNGNMTLTYQLEEGEEATLEVFDLMGKRVFGKQVIGTGILSFTMANVSSGLYSVRVIVDNEIRLSEKISILKE